MRPDFNGAFVQFLIGLLQTAFPDLKKKLRCQYTTTLPDTDILYERFKLSQSSFNLWGDAPLFMQDLGEIQGKSSPINC